MPQSSSHFSSSPTLHISPMSVSSPLAAIPSFDNSGMDPAQASLNSLQQIIGALDNTLRLPNTPRAFAVYLLGLLIVFAGAFMHVYVAAQIMQAEFTLSQLREEYRSIEQQNGDIIFQIARDTNMARLHERVLAMGYVPVQKREYVFVPSATVAQVPTPTEEIAETTLPAAIATTTVAPASNFGRTTGWQGGRWEEFWNAVWRAATLPGPAAPSVTANNPSKNGIGNTQPANANPNFWAVWWKQASEQGSKLLDQVRGQ